VREITRRLFEGPNAAAHFVKDEKSELASTLKRLLPPDMLLEPEAPEIGFIHRSTNDGEIYFVANTANTTRRVKATFRVKGLEPQIWNPLTGAFSAAEAATRTESGASMSLELEPYGSRVIVFTRNRLQPSDLSSSAATVAPLDLSSDWRVTFGAGGSANRMDQLRSWTERDETKYFSGVATYEKTATMAKESIVEGRKIFLDFGEGKPLQAQNLRAGMQVWFDAPIREAAVVYVNEQRVGSVWCPPYSIDVTRYLHAGDNRLKIQVGNLALNYMAGRCLPDYRLLNLRFGERFQAQDMDKVRAEPAGLLGPVRLIWR
jgi:hypothetical protein